MTAPEVLGAPSTSKTCAEAAQAVSAGERGVAGSGGSRRARLEAQILQAVEVVVNDDGRRENGLRAALHYVCRESKGRGTRARQHVSRKARRVRAAVRAAHHDQPRVLARAAEAAGAWSQRSACLFFRLVPTAAAGCAARAACSRRPAWPRPPRGWQGVKRGREARVSAGAEESAALRLRRLRSRTWRIES